MNLKKTVKDGKMHMKKICRKILCGFMTAAVSLSLVWAPSVPGRRNPVNEKKNEVTVSAATYSSAYKTSLTKARQVLKLVNRERRKRGLPALTLTTKLNRAAYRRSKELTKKFTHTRPNGDECFTVFTQYRVRYSYCGENIAAGMTTPKAVVGGWMNSPGHRANILNRNYRHMGIGFAASNGKYHYYWAQEFTD